MAKTEPVERLNVSTLLLDYENPRLAEFGVDEDTPQREILEYLWEECDVEEVAMSIAHSGYFDHEPLLVEYDRQNHPVVIEGNRRLAAVMVLRDRKLQKRLRASNLPKVPKSKLAKLEYLPCVITTRKDSWRYLGFKHVNGASTWGAYAKAKYVAQVHSLYNVPLDAIAEQIGDKFSTVERMYRGLMVVEQAERKELFDRKNTSKPQFYFNYIYSGITQPGIKKFLGLTETTASTDSPVPKEKLDHLRELLLWLYGDGKAGVQSLIRSQNPDLGILDSIIQTKAGLATLRAGMPLEVAHEVSMGDERVFENSMRQAKVSLQKAYGTLSTGYTTKNKELFMVAKDIATLAKDLLDEMDRKNPRSARELDRA